MNVLRSTTVVRVTLPPKGLARCSHAAAIVHKYIPERSASLAILPMAMVQIGSNSRSFSSSVTSYDANKQPAVKAVAAQQGPADGEVKTLSDMQDPADKKSLFTPEQYLFAKSAFAHPGFKGPDMKAVDIHHKEPENIADRIALATLRTVRWSFDKVTGYTHPPKGKEDDPTYKLSEDAWLLRFIFLESVAGVPGMVGGMVRHLHSIRLLRRDRAWIETLLEEAYNERMHLLTFMQLRKPSLILKLAILGAQGIFFNAFFLAYLINPRICHRFVGYLEEEAVVTYTRCINEMEKGFYPEWAATPAPDIAVQYWHLPEEHRNLRDILYYVRADECKHREVNHTFGNLKQGSDPNPYAMVYPSPDGKVHPSKGLDSNLARPVGWERNEIEVTTGGPAPRLKTE